MRFSFNGWLSRCLLLSAVLALAPVAYADLEEVRQQLVEQIRTAQSELSAAQTRIARERGDIANRVRTAQDRVLDLREQTRRR